MPDAAPGPESSQGQNVSPQEAAPKPQASASETQKPIGKEEQDAASRIRQGGNVDQTLKDITKGWDEVRNEEGSKKPEQKLQPIEVISQEQVDTYKRILQERYGIDLSTVSVDIASPGSEVFDAEEIKFRFFQHPDKANFDELRDLLEQHEANPQNVPIDSLRTAAQQRGIVLEGRMPGFAAVSGDNRIVFFEVSQEDAIPMAQRYAQKEGEAGRIFATSEEASTYLKSLGEKAFLHEVGHVVYGRTGAPAVLQWNNYVEGNQALKDQVISIQEDKYDDITQIPVAEEAFADYFVDVVGEGRVISRLEANSEANQMLSQMLIPEQPDNTAKPGEVIDNLNRLRQALDRAQPVDVPNNPSNSPPILNKYGETQEE